MIKLIENQSIATHERKLDYMQCKCIKSVFFSILYKKSFDIELSAIVN